MARTSSSRTVRVRPAATSARASASASGRALWCQGPAAFSSNQRLGGKEPCSLGCSLPYQAHTGQGSDTFTTCPAGSVRTQLTDGSDCCQRQWWGLVFPRMVTPT
jgi:hypothetical protein